MLKRQAHDFPLGTKVRVNGLTLPPDFRNKSCVEVQIIGMSKFRTSNLFCASVVGGWTLTLGHLSGWEFLPGIKPGHQNCWYVDFSRINSIVG